MDELLKKIDSFEGKRNTVITMFFPPNVIYKKQMEKIYRIVKAIKHANKRYQIMKVLKLIDERNEGRKTFEPSGMIVCAAFTKHKDLPVYYELEPPNYSPIAEFEYFYDQMFHTNRIREIMFASTVSKPTYDEQKELIRNTEERILSTNNEIVLQDLAVYAMETHMCQEFLYFKEETLPLDLINLAKSSRSKIILFDMTKLECKEFAKKYGQMISTLRFPMELKRFDNDC